LALQIPNLDRISKDNPKLAEALLKIQQYSNFNVSPVAGNKVAPPPINSTRIPG
jgi:hypothetical protein